MKSSFIIPVLFLIVLLGCKNSGSGGSGNNKAQGHVARYSGQVAGAITSGDCSFEDHRNVGGTLGMSCILSNSSFSYTFNAEMVNSVTGYADMLEVQSGSRMKIQVNWSDGTGTYPPSGFELIVNPFGAAPTRYMFQKN